MFRCLPERGVVALMILQQLVNGLAVGAVYSLIALGFTMIYGVLRIVNFAHGSIYMVGAFMGLTVAKHLHTNLWISITVAMLGAAILGILVDHVSTRQLRSADPYSALLSTLGVSIALSVTAELIWGSSTQPFPSGMAVHTYEVAGVVVNSFFLIIIGVTLVLMVALYLFVQKSPLGVAMRAVSHSVDTARLMGINVDMVIRMTFAISGALAAAGGVLVSVYYDAIYPSMGYVAGLKAFTAAVVGGIGSIPGAILGGFLLGLAENFGAAYLSSGYKDAIAFTILLAVLLIKPAGLLGRHLVQKL
ncbi:MAG: high-affinity branched-chain amino acid transport system permease protein LivH [Firmicutes bacterium]|nr:high-affinity branched-chain amino acid transport system permease protein LivH [Bacillota bacterium]